MLGTKLINCQNCTFGHLKINLWALNVKVSRGRSSSGCWGAGFTVEMDGVMGGTNDAKFGVKRRFGNLEIGDKKGEEVERR